VTTSSAPADAFSASSDETLTVGGPLLHEQRDGAKHDERRVGDHCIDAKALTG
jgi:hypothetical protein